MANDLVRVMEEADNLTGQATAAITGKRFLRISGARAHKFNVLGTTPSDNSYKVAPCNAVGMKAIGAAKYDQANIGGKVGIARGGICPVLAGAAITAGVEIMTDATGQAIPFVSAAGQYAIGLAMDDAASGTDAEVLL